MAYDEAGPGVKQVSEMGKLVFLPAIAVFLTAMTAMVAACGSSEPTGQDSGPANTVAPPRESAASGSRTAHPTSTNTAAGPREANASASNTASLSPTTTPPSTLPATEAAPNAAVPPSTPTPVPDDDDGLEFESTDPPVSSARDGGIGGVDKEPPEASGSSDDSVKGRSYTWEDGDRSLTVYLQSDLAVEESADGFTRGIVEAGQGGDQVASNSLPVFRSEYGELMTLPGGVCC